jgi:all-trans-retinol 13,14-reductase
MDGGDTIRAKMGVVSACGANNTWGKLMPKELVPPGVTQLLEKVGTSATIGYLFIGLDVPEGGFNPPLPSWNIWRWPTGDDCDLDKMITAFQDDPEGAPIPLFCGFPSEKDSTYKSRFPGKATAVLLTIGKYEWFEKWEGTKWGKRGAEYEAFKDRLSKRILEEGLYHMWPQTKGHVTYTAFGSPLTYNHFIGSQRGEAYGMSSHEARFANDDWLRPVTPVPGLWMTGQDVAVAGVTGALMAGVLSAMAILGYGSIFDVLSGRNIVEDLWHLDQQEASAYSDRSKSHYAQAYAANK